ncbi:MAG: hypothetical protein U1F98_13675 [Verrucomicrobiota bacterium]
MKKPSASGALNGSAHVPLPPPFPAGVIQISTPPRPETRPAPNTAIATQTT